MAYSKRKGTELLVQSGVERSLIHRHHRLELHKLSLFEITRKDCRGTPSNGRYVVLRGLRIWAPMEQAKVSMVNWLTCYFVLQWSNALTSFLEVPLQIRLRQVDFEIFPLVNRHHGFNPWLPIRRVGEYVGNDRLRHRVGHEVLGICP